MLDRLRAQLDRPHAEIDKVLQQILGGDVVAEAETVGHVEPDLHSGPA
jgi:hypothetical protein